VFAGRFMFVFCKKSFAELVEFHWRESILVFRFLAQGQDCQRRGRCYCDATRVIEATDDGWHRSVVARQVTNERVLDVFRGGGCRDVERDSVGSNFKSFERATDRFTQNRRTCRERLLDDQVIKLLVLRASHPIATNLKRDFRPPARRREAA